MTLSSTSFQPKSLSSKGMELLNNQGALIAKIFSYVIQDTKDLADLRLVSKEWNANMRPHVLRDFGFRKVCFDSEYDYWAELVHVGGENSNAGGYYEPSFDFKFFVSPKDLVNNKEEIGNKDDQGLEGEDHQARSAWAKTEAILFCKDDDDMSKVKKRKYVVEKASEDYDFLKKDASLFAYTCKRITEAKSDIEFEVLVDDGLSDGLFLCLEDLEQAKKGGALIEMGREGRYGGYRHMILNLTLPKGHGVEVTEVFESKIAYLKVKIEKEPDNIEDIESAFPFVKDFKNPALESNDCHVYPTFVGYNVEEHEDGGLSCHVPFAVHFNDGLTDESWNWDVQSFLPVDSLWSKCQEQHVREGVAIADDFVPGALHENLMRQIDNLVKSQIVDFHPHSNGVVRDIVHPALYSYVKGVSPLLKPEEEINALPQRNDYWGREYEASAKYQWLPTYFAIAEDGSCTICDYINNLVPRSDHEALYESLATLFSQVLPLIESVYGYCRVVKENHHIRIPGDWGYGYFNELDPKVSPIEERPVSLRGQQLQVVTKIVDYELGPGETFEGVWHVEGMSHEEIVATAIYFIDRDDEIEGGDILFKRGFHNDEAGYIHCNLDQYPHQALDAKIREGIMPIGQVKTLPGRLLVFPNSHVHKVTELKNTSTGKDSAKKKRRIIVFFLINPERRIVSTREVPVQQEHAGGTMKRSDALEHRLKLMSERKYTKQDFNARPVELCEH